MTRGWEAQFRTAPAKATPWRKGQASWGLFTARTCPGDRSQDGRGPRCSDGRPGTVSPSSPLFLGLCWPQSLSQLRPAGQHNQVPGSVSTGVPSFTHRQTCALAAWSLCPQGQSLPGVSVQHRETQGDPQGQAGRVGFSPGHETTVCAIPQLPGILAMCPLSP